MRLASPCAPAAATAIVLARGPGTSRKAKTATVHAHKMMVLEAPRGTTQRPSRQSDGHQPATSRQPGPFNQGFTGVPQTREARAGAPDRGAPKSIRAV